MGKSVYYQGGTLVLRDVDAQERPPAPFKLIRERWRCEGYHYGTIQPYLEEQDVRDTVPRWQPLNLKIQEAREAHDYQVAALAAWDMAGQRGWSTRSAARLVCTTAARRRSCRSPLLPTIRRVT